MVPAGIDIKIQKIRKYRKNIKTPSYHNYITLREKTLYLKEALPSLAFLIFKTSSGVISNRCSQAKGFGFIPRAQLPCSFSLYFYDGNSVINSREVLKRSKGSEH